MTRLLPSCFGPTGKAKKRFDTIEEAASFALDHGAASAYRCYCGKFHVARRARVVPPDPGGQKALASIRKMRIELLGAGWERIDSPKGERWIRPTSKQRKNDKRRTLRDAYRVLQEVGR